MAQAKKGDKVKVNYTGTLSSGEVFDTSKDREPLEFEVGGGQMIKGFDSAVEGMKLGESKTVTIPAAEAYGEQNPDLVGNLEKKQLPPDMSPEVGQQLQIGLENGHAIQAEIIEITDEFITVDANHPLAGKDLTFEITLEEIA